MVGLSAGIQARETTLHGVWLLASEPIADHRGWFVRTSDADVLAGAGIDHRQLVQESQSRSVRGTIRGLHARRELTEAKLVRCAHGEVFEAVVDLRPWSESYLRTETFTLDDARHHQLYIPPGCAHGFQALSEVADICYRMDAPYRPGLDLSVAFDDPDLAIAWPLADPIVSERDRSAPRLADVEPHLAEYFGAGAAPAHATQESH